MVTPKMAMLLTILPLLLCGMSGAEIISGQCELKDHEWLFVNGTEFRTMIVQYDTENEKLLVNDFVIWEKHEPVDLDDIEEPYWSENTIKIQSCIEESGHPDPEGIVQRYLSRFGSEGGFTVVVVGPCGSGTLHSRNYPEEVDQLRAIIETKTFQRGPFHIDEMKCLGFEVGWPPEVD